MDIETLKDALGEKFDELKTYVDGLIGARDAAKNESISNRKKFQAKITALEETQQTTFEKLGIAAADELDDLELPDAGEQAAAVKQLETKIRRLEGEVSTGSEKYLTLEGKWKEGQKASAIRKAITGHKFNDTEVAELLIGKDVVFEGDDILYQSPEGKLIPLADGAALIAKTKPHLIEGSGQSGSGYSGGGSSGDDKNPFAKESFNLTKQGEIFRDDPSKAKQMAAAAGVTI